MSARRGAMSLVQLQWQSWVMMAVVIALAVAPVITPRTKGVAVAFSF